METASKTTPPIRRRSGPNKVPSLELQKKPASHERGLYARSTLIAWVLSTSPMSRQTTRMLDGDLEPAPPSGRFATFRHFGHGLFLAH